MKNIFKLGTLLFLFTLCGCDDDSKEIFEGVDNHINSFTLTSTGGTRYEAAIIGNQIVMTIPQNESLQDAKVEYSVCEQTDLFPSPANIKDWNNEHVFRVVSHNQTLRDYTYTVKRKDVNSEGTIELLTQTDVNAFAQTGINTIEGSLILGSINGTTDDPIKDLSPLSGLTNVRYNIVINNSFAGSSLAGLENIVSAGGLTIGSATTPTTPKEGIAVVLSSLESLGKLQINSSQVTALILPKLKTVGDTYIDANMLAMADFSSLETCDENFIMKASSGNTYLTTLALPAFNHVRCNMQIEKYTKIETLSLPKLEKVGGNVTLSTLGSITELSLPEFAQCGGSFSSANLNKATKISLPKLVSVPTLSLTGNTSNSSTEEIELPLLENVSNDLTIKMGALSIETLSLPALKNVGGKLDIEYLKSLTSLEIPSLSSVGTSIYLYYLVVLSALDINKVENLPSLEIVACYQLADIKANAELSNVKFNAGSQVGAVVPTFVVPTKINGKLEVSNYRYSSEDDWVLKNVTYIGTFTYSGSGTAGTVNALFEDLEEIGTFDVSNGNYFKSISFPKLKEVKEKFTLNYTQNINNGGINIPVLKKIKSLTFNGSSYASGASSFKLRTNLEDFSNVEEIGDITIKWWGAISDFSGLKKAVPSLTSTTWNVLENLVYNPTYQDMVDGKYTKE